MKDVLPGNKLPQGLVSEGASAIKNGYHNIFNLLITLIALEGFNKAKKSDLINEKRPEVFFTARSSQPIGPNLKSISSQPYPQISKNSENSVLISSATINDLIPQKNVNKTYNLSNSMTPSVTNSSSHKTMSSINNLAKNSLNNIDALTNKKVNDSSENNKRSKSPTQSKSEESKLSSLPSNSFGPNSHSNSNKPSIYSGNTPTNTNPNGSKTTLNKKK